MKVKDKIRGYLRQAGLVKDPLAPNRIWTARSAALHRKVRVDFYLPYREPGLSYPVVVFNDGQDLRAMRFKATLRKMTLRRQIEPLIAVGVHAGDRIREYGVIKHPDYLGRGDKAAGYAHFIAHELFPKLKRDYSIDPAPGRHVVAGFSLGGLSAFDLAWNYPHLFGKAGVFSGALWWRSQAFREDDPDAHRIMHQVVKAGEKRPGQQYWFMAGTEDETSDRNKNGVIDAIDDTLDLIAALREIGCSEEDLTYLELEGGRHEPATWAQVMPEFLKWAFGP